MAQYYTDFSEYTTSAAPSDWTARWVTSGVTYEVREEVGATGGKYLRGVRASSGARSLLSWDAIDGDAGRATLDILVRVRASARPSNTQVFGVTARASGAASSESGYNALPIRMGISRVGFVGISKYVSGAFTTGLFEEKAWSAGTWYWARIQYVGSTQRVRRWSGALGDEPGTWDATYTDSSLSSAGWVGLLFPSTDVTVDVDIFSVGTGGDAAPAGPPITGTVDAVAPAARVYAADALGTTGTAAVTAPAATVSAEGTTWPVLSAFEINGGTAWTSVSELADFLAAVEAASGGRMTHSVVGTSVNGNPIHLVRVGPEAPTAGTVLVVAQQHGNEPSGREAGLQMLRNLALTDDADTIAYLQDTAWLFMPSINPDQLGVDRENSNGKDLNREHLALSQPEVRAIHAVIRDYQPHVLIDQHEDGTIVPSEVHFARAHNPQVPASIRTHSAALKTAAEAAVTAAGYTPQTYATSTDTRLLRTVGGLRYAVTLLSEVRRPGTNIEGAVQRVYQQRIVLESVLAYHAEHRDDIASERATAIAAKITEGATQSAAFQIRDSASINPPPIAYRLTSGQRAAAAHQFDLWVIDEVDDGAGGAYVFMGQAAQPLIPFAFDSRADYEIIAATPHDDLSTTGEAAVTAPAAMVSATGDVMLSGQASGASAASAALDTAIRLSASVAGAAAVTGALQTAIRLAGQVAGTSAVQATLDAPTTLAGSVAGGSTATADLVTAVALAATVAGAAQVQGTLSTAVTLAGAIAGTATATASLATGSGLQGAVSGAAAASGSLQTGISLAGSIVGASDALAALYAPAGPGFDRAPWRAEVHVVEDWRDEVWGYSVMVGVIKRIPKRADAIQRIGVDWSPRLRSQGATILTSTWEAEAGADVALVGDLTAHDGLRTSVLVAGGTLGQRDRVRNIITTSDGQTLPRALDVDIVADT